MDYIEDLPIASTTYVDGWLSHAYEERRAHGGLAIKCSVRRAPSGTGVVVRVYSRNDVDAARALIADAEEAQRRSLSGRHAA